MRAIFTFKYSITSFLSFFSCIFYLSFHQNYVNCLYTTTENLCNEDLAKVLATKYVDENSRPLIYYGCELCMRFHIICLGISWADF